MIDDRDALIEAAATAFRERDASGRILASPAWADLAPADCDALYERQLATRQFERALDDDRLSATARVALERARSVGQLGE